MKRLALLFGSLLCAFGWAHGQVTAQAFTGSVIANSVVTPTGYATAAPGDRISGMLTINSSGATIVADTLGLNLYGQYWSGQEYFLVGTGVTFTVTDNYGPTSITNPVPYNLTFTSTYPNGSIFFVCSGVGPTLVPFTIPEGCSVGVSIITSYRFPYNYSINPQLVFSIDRFTASNSLSPQNLYKGNGNGCGCKTPQSQRADPVTVGTGNLYEEVTDYTTTGPNSLSWTRFYNSQGNTGSLATSLGTKWRSNFDRHLRISSSQVIAERSDGQEITFTLQNGSWITDSDVDLALASSGSNWTLTDGNDVVETYRALGSASALLASVESRNGYTQTLAYNSSNQPTTITDSYSRSLILTYQNGLLKTVASPDGTVLTYAFAANGTNYLLTSVTYSTNPQTNQTYVYGDIAFPFALTEIVDEDGNQYETWTYDSLGRVVTNYGGTKATTSNLISFAYDNASGNATVSNALGESDTYLFTTLLGTAKVAEIDRQATSTTAAAKRIFTYDANGYLSGQTDWDGNQTTFVNNVHGQPTSIVEAAGTSRTRTTSIAYDPTFIHLPKQIARPNITTNFVYDGSGNQLTRTVTDTTTATAPYSTSGQTRVSSFTWNNFGLLATAQTARTDLKATTHYYYDSTFALSKITNPLGQSMQITSNTAGGRPQTVVDPNGVTTQLVYDGRQRLTGRAISTSAGTLTTSFGYDAAGNLIETTLPDGSFLMDTYDTAHRLTQVTDSLGNYTTYTLDGLGDRKQTGVYQKNVAIPTWQGSGMFDALGRELVHTGGAGQTTTKTYDANGNTLTVQEGISHTTTNTYDALNRLANSTDANSGVTTPAYDTNDRVVSITDANGNATGYVRNGFGDVIQQSSPDSGVASFYYDGDANLTTKIDALGITTSQTFDALDRPLTTTYPTHPAENVSYSYDQTGTGFSFGIGRLTNVIDAAGSLSRRYDERGDLITENRVNGTKTLTTGYTYDGASRITSMSYPDGTLAGYQRDVAGYLTTVTAKLPGASSTTTLANLTHLPFGPINSVNNGNGVAETWMFDASYRPSNITDALASTNLQNLTYGYDTANNVKTIMDGVSPANSQTFGYDPINRLASAVSGTGGYGSLAWTYDKVGNRLTQMQGNTATNYSYAPGTNRLLTISPNAARAQLKPFLIKKTIVPTGGDFWANAPPGVFPRHKPEAPESPSMRLSGFLGWPLLLIGSAGIFSLRRRLRAQTPLAIVFLASLLTGSATLLSGCIGTPKLSSNPDPATSLAVTGDVHGGQQPVAGATLQLYAVGATGDGSAATPLFQTAVKTTAAGNFTFPAYTCPSATTQVYLLATGGNPGFASATNNTAIALMAALGPCGLLTASTYVSVNELTTVGSLATLYPFMNSATGIGSGSGDASQLAAAFSLVNEYTNTATGAVPGATLPAGYYASSFEIKTLSNIIATCINSAGGIAGDGSPCGTLFALATPAGGSAPTDTIQAALDIFRSPGQNVAALYNLAGPAAPFQPSLSAAPSSWSLPILPLPILPTIAPAAGIYTTAQMVTLSGATTGSTIYYTINGNVPTTSSAKYTGPITVASTEAINAVAAINASVTSGAATASYVISGTTPTISVVTNANGNITDVPSADGAYYLHFTYNNANRSASVTGGSVAATFVYDWAGQRFSKTNGGIPATVYSYGQDGAVIAENDSGTVTDYVYADGRPIAMLQPSATPVANQASYIIADRLGTPQRLINSGGSTVWTTAYQPFGTTGTITATVNQNLRFPGQLADAETGFSYNHFRDYMPNLGRYLETDPIGLRGGLNSYSYANGSSVRYTDPSGLASTQGLFGRTLDLLPSQDEINDAAITLMQSPNPVVEEAGLALEIGDGALLGAEDLVGELESAFGRKAQCTSSDFYVNSSGTAIPGTGYRAIGGPAVPLAQGGNLMSGSGTTYVTFDSLSGLTGNQAAQFLQLTHTPSYFATFDTLQLVDDLTIPYGRWNTSLTREPITSTFPEYGAGGATQAITGTPIGSYTLTRFGP